MHFVVTIFLASLSIVRGELTMISFSIGFFPPLTFLLYYTLCQQSLNNSFYLSFPPPPTLSKSRLMQSPSQFRFFSPSFPLHILGICSLPVFHLPFFYMTSPCTPHQFLLRTFLHSNHQSDFTLFSYQLS